jgi:5-methyltetrahydropteroyltriglutamate--homocysteine methyltransferase
LLDGRETTWRGTGYKELRGKDVLLGLVNVGSETVETPEDIAGGLRHALCHVAPQRLFACTDCGLVLRSREAAAAKMRALVAGAAIVNGELARAGGP